MDQLSYCHSAFFGTQVAEDLAQLLVDSTGGKLSKLFVVSSGKSIQDREVGDSIDVAIRI
jgi:adenosylmethionine-8-amino-7-oxononanoate aminotransferase